MKYGYLWMITQICISLLLLFTACNKESIENDIPGEALQAILNEACIVVVEYIIMN